MYMAEESIFVRLGIYGGDMNLKYIFIHGTAGWGSYDKRYERMPYWGMRGDRYVPRKGMEPFFVMRSFQMGQYTGLTKGGTRIDQRWGKNDGRVNTISEISPFGAPRKHLEPDNLKPGIWNVYPVYKGDHMSLQGGLLHKKNIRSFYTDMLTMIDAINRAHFSI